MLLSLIRVVFTGSKTKWYILGALGCVLSVFLTVGYIKVLKSDIEALESNRSELQVYSQSLEAQLNVYKDAVENLGKVNKKNREELDSKLSTLQGAINEERRLADGTGANSIGDSSACPSECLDRLRRITKEANKQFR